MEKDQLTFNDLPNVVGELCDRIASMENLLTEKLSKQYETKENTHVPMTVQEACNYLKMPLSTFYYKVKKDDIPVIKQGKHLYIYRDELDRIKGIVFILGNLMYGDIKLCSIRMRGCLFL